MSDNIKAETTWNGFQKLDIRTGTILKAAIFQEANNPSYKMEIDFGVLGIKKTSAQLTKLYNPEELIGKQIIAVVNFPSKQIANTMSECLVLGAVEPDGKVTLLTSEKIVPNGIPIG